MSQLMGGTGLATFDFFQKQTLNVASPGQITLINTSGMNSVRTEVLGAGPANEVQIQASMESGGPWYTVESITGNNVVLKSIQGYQYLRLITTNYDNIPFQISFKGNSETIPADFSGSVTVSLPSTQEIAITGYATGPGNPDSIRITDGDQELQINPDGSINVDLLYPSTPVITTSFATTANTTYSFAIPSGARRLSFRVRNESAIIKIATSSSDLSSGIYFTINRGCSYSVDHIESAGLTFYYQATKNSTTVEIMYWM